MWCGGTAEPATLGEHGPTRTLTWKNNHNTNAQTHTNTVHIPHGAKGSHRTEFWIAFILHSWLPARIDQRGSGRDCRSTRRKPPTTSPVPNRSHILRNKIRLLTGTWTRTSSISGKNLTDWAARRPELHDVNIWSAECSRTSELAIPMTHYCKVHFCRCAGVIFWKFERSTLSNYWKQRIS